MSILNRPYAGTWAPNKRNVVQWTPDFLVYLNGDTSLPGCPTCRHNIDLNEFINSVSVDFGVEPGASNCSIGMAIPRHYGDTLFRDGNTLLRPALEIHVYFRGYFPMKGLTTPNSRPVAGVNLGDIPQHPYYPVFHGVVTQVTHEYSGGFYTANMTCAGMLHFWETQKVSGASGGSFFGARPVNSGVQTTLTGHPMTGKTPYGIIYTLYRDTAGVADGVGFALSSRTNYGAINAATGDSLYAMTLRYWEQRFRGKIYGLRMHGASGQLFTSSQQAYLSLYRTNAIGGGSPHSTANVNNSTAHPSDDIFAQDPTLLLGLRAQGEDGRVLRQPDTRLGGAVDNRGRIGLDVMQLQAFPTDIGSYGQVNLWESTYESKMDIATAVTNVCGYEFYQDADGDLVFKPPLYNLDTSSSRVYRIEPEDIVSINFTEAEPNATYCIIKGGAFQNMRGVVDESEWGMRSTYVDYKLVAQYGWKEASLESTYYTNAKSAYYFAISHLDKQNVGVNGCSVTIPLRPEIRPGYPVYIPHIDCFYYVTQVSHAFNLGSECTTTLTLTARRRKFLPPGKSGTANISFDQQLTQIDLSATANAVRPLQTLDRNDTPRITGFPNVVMAIDPEKINPMFEVIGFQAVERELTTRSRGVNLERRRQSFVWRFIRMALTRTPRVLEPYGVSSNEPTDDYLAANPRAQYKVCPVSRTDADAIIISVRQIELALEQYVSTRATLRRARALLVQQAVQQQNTINDAQRTYTRAQREADNQRDRGQDVPTPPEPDNTAQRRALQDINDKLLQFDRNFDAVPEHNSIAEYAAQYETLATIVNGINGNNPPRLNPTRATRGAPNVQRDGTILMSFLIGQFRPSGPQSSDTVTDPSGTTNQSALLLEQLADRKASLNLTVPGYYRYYSASHPNPDMQGYENITGTIERGNVSGSNRSTVTEQGRIVGAVQRVATQQTRMSSEQIAGYVIQAYRTIYGRSPPRGVAEIITAQSMLETGSGTDMYNYNFGGIKALRGGLRFFSATRRGGPTPVAFQAYGTPEEGARHLVRILVSGRHHNAIRQFRQALSQGYPAAARAYVTSLGPPPGGTGYFTDNVEGYLRDLPIDRARRAVANAVTPSGPTNPSRNESAANAPENSPARQTETSPTPEPPVTTYGVRPLTDGRGISEDRVGQYVELFNPFSPTKGLRVRTIEESGTKVVPTNLIYSMTFEARKRTLYTRASVPNNNPFPPRNLKEFIDLCLQGLTPTEQLVVRLAETFAQQVGDTELTTQRRTFDAVRALITLAVDGITGLRTSTGLIANTLNIPANGIPGNYNPSDLQATSTRQDAITVLRAKALGLIRDVSLANGDQLRQAKDLIDALGPNDQITSQIQVLVQPWEDSLRALFRGNPLPQVGPFRNQAEVRREESSTDDFSPVFPVSDALGYEHYGSFQYGRGLSIEPGGNYERLMSTDPLQYATDAQREVFLRALRSNPGNASARAAAVQEALTSIANDPAFRNGPGAQVVLDYLENDQRNGDRTTMIANGLRNYIMSNHDTVMKLPVNNVAYQFADLRPMGQQDTCECRGAEADLLLAAYMAGTESYALITSSEEATAWVSSQMQQAANAWSEAQSRMRGMASDQGRRSILDTVEGWQGFADNFRSTNEENVDRANRAVDSADALGERTRDLFTRPLVPNRGQ